MALVLGEGGNEASLTIIRHGVSFPFDISWPLAMRAYLWVGDELKLDASQESFVRDESWQEMLQELEYQGFALARYWLENHQEIEEGLGPVALQTRQVLSDRSTSQPGDPKKVPDLKFAASVIHTPTARCVVCDGSRFDESPLFAGQQPVVAMRGDKPHPVFANVCLGCATMRTRVYLS